MSIMPSSHFPPLPPTTSEPAPQPPAPSVAPSYNGTAARYFEAYAATRSQYALGRSIRMWSLIVGGLLLLTGLFLLIAGGPPNAQEPGIFGSDKTVYHAVGVFVAAAGLVLGALSFLLGVLIGSLAQVTRASLDAAVNTSPLLDADERARVLAQ